LPLIQQDFDTCVTVQQALASGLAGRGRVSHLESTLTHFWAWLVARYQAGAAVPS
jgi:hypothetical protein